MRTLTVTLNVPKHVTHGYLKHALDTLFDHQFEITKAKIKNVSEKLYRKRMRIESVDEKETRFDEEREMVNEEKEIFRAIERMRDLEFA